MIQQKHFDKSIISFSTKKIKKATKFCQGDKVLPWLYCADVIMKKDPWFAIATTKFSVKKYSLILMTNIKKQKRINHMIKNILQKTWNIVGIRILLLGRDLHAYNASSPNHENCYLKTPFISFPYLHPITQEHYRKSKYSNCPGHTYNSEIKKSKMSWTFHWRNYQIGIQKKSKNQTYSWQMQILFMINEQISWITKRDLTDWEEEYLLVGNWSLNFAIIHAVKKKSTRQMDNPKKECLIIYLKCASVGIVERQRKKRFTKIIRELY